MSPKLTTKGQVRSGQAQKPKKQRHSSTKKEMQRDASGNNTYNYGDMVYWDARYLQESASTFDWYQRYSALRPLIRHHVPTSSRLLMVGCGNAVMSEDMVKDGYEDIVNIDISSVAINMMKKKHAHISQLQYMQMDVRDMSFFPDESFDNVMDKARPGFERSASTSSSPAKSLLEPVPISENGLLPADFVLEDPDSHFIYVCKKMDEAELACSTSHLLMPTVV
ncbi:hypothetical protein Scep_003881 [Stephania cephalantha]|uniref:Methyltransferase type 11 domain-containing protein n=1 Tax=Stephania cephalantha TaxID=152367 RepID=A0AAP0KT96_9MAGN